ncbi:MAG TPA: GMC family oxidoreductase [Gaiellaceae bacterium]|nr:GMC family oxidoreductase [Gaiellaceae bacterium]
MENDYDVIVIGSGAGGGTLAHRLAPTGLKVLILERGDYIARERENWDSREVITKGRYKTREKWIDKDGQQFHPGQHYYVGGQTKFYGAILFRLREDDFGVVYHHGGISPAWPLTYDDLEPYYAQAEHLYHVHGQAGEDPSEPWRSSPFPYPAVSHEPRIQRLHDDFARAGLNPFHLPVGVMLDESRPQTSPCIRCSKLDGFPCLMEAKADAHVCAVKPALMHDNVTLLRNARVERLETDERGDTVTGVVVDRDGVPERYRADVVVVSCGAVNSAALLLRSASDRHPAGLANSSGVVGRHYMAHLNSALVAVSKDPNPTRFQKTLGVNDFYRGSADWDFPLGHIQMLGKSDREVIREGAPLPAPGFALDYIADHAVDFWLTSEDLPHPENRVTVDRNGRIHVAYTDRNLEGHKRLIAKLKGLLTHLGCHPTLLPNQLIRDGRIPLAGVAHQCGTVRFGDDPETSALDVHCKAHDLDNLYVVDTSFFPSSSAVNPALTAMANAMRVGDHLIERLGAHAPQRMEEEVMA